MKGNSVHVVFCYSKFDGKADLQANTESNDTGPWIKRWDRLGWDRADWSECEVGWETLGKINGCAARLTKTYRGTKGYEGTTIDVCASFPVSQHIHLSFSVFRTQPHTRSSRDVSVIPPHPVPSPYPGSCVVRFVFA